MNDFQPNSANWITPDWPIPWHVKSLVTTRIGGVSLPPFNGLNLALHVGDNPEHVAANRQILQAQAHLPNSPCWLNQQHTTHSVYLTPDTSVQSIADASWTDKPGVVCVVMTADCLPILVTNKAGTLVSAIHAGWKGLANGILEQTLVQLPERAENLLVWIGPAISVEFFEVGQDVLDAFCHKRPHFKRFFKPILTRPGQFLANLALLARAILTELGVLEVYGGHLCSFADAEQFYSYRRDGQTGRMASLIWLDSAKP